jgi:hypothetical protein
MAHQSTKRSPKAISPTQRDVLQAKVDIHSAAISLASASTHATNPQTAEKLAALSRAAESATEALMRIARNLGARR